MKEQALREMIHSRIMAKEQEVASVKRLAAEGGIASDESAVAEPEIEANEGSAEEYESDPDESAAVEGDSGEAGCPIEMGVGGPRCRRKLHVTPDGVDEEPVCLMHSKDPHKKSGPLFDAFWLEFERILEVAGEGDAHFDHFVIPPHNFSGRTFHAICRFEKAIFAHDAIFFGATFNQNVIFWKTTFSKDAEFLGVTFKQKAFFDESTFKQHADFGGVAFTQNAGFIEAIFTLDADFGEATFGQEAKFHLATFIQDADFSKAIFTKNADFSNTTFIRAARFVETTFGGMANWLQSQFLDQAEYRRTKFISTAKRRPSAVFALAKFSKPSEVVFDGVDLSRILFHNCDVSQVWFTSFVTWAKRSKTRGLAVFDEKYRSKEWSDELDIFVPVQLDYRAVAQIYQQLKKNYDSRLDYWTANEFHYGEMEMKRLAGPTDGRLLGLRRWWHRNLSFVALYKYASDYGNSYGKPAVWLLGVLLAAALLFPIPGVGLKPPISGDAASTARVTYIGVWNQQDSWSNNFWREAKLIGKSGITAIDTATFQRTPEYAPVYPLGRVVAIVETLLTSSLFALFLLAIRRQFRR